MAAEPHYFGIRHHGPGCARSLRAAFDTLQPDCVLIEGPPESDALIGLVTKGLQPPVALLGYCPDTPGLAVYHPFAEFSPEWQAMCWAVEHGVPVRFIDLPLAHGLAIEQQQRAEAEARATQERLAPADDEDDADDAQGDVNTDAPLADAEAVGAEGAPAAEPPTDAAQEADAALKRLDPLHWLAQAAGHGDGETWWNQMVEERGDGAELFAAIAEAMRALREADAQAAHDAYALREARREAHMRSCVRAARKDGHARIAVVCGAWHVPALVAPASEIIHDVMVPLYHPLVGVSPLTACALAAVEAGANWTDASVIGIGDRGGTVALEEAAALFEMYGYQTGIKLSD